MLHVMCGDADPDLNFFFNENIVNQALCRFGALVVEEVLRSII